jgi:hypothetical protein
VATLHPLQSAANLLVHCFARVEWQQIEGGKWKSSGGRVLSNEAYQRHQARVKAAGGKGAKKPAAKPGPGRAPAMKTLAAKAEGSFRSARDAEGAGDTEAARNHRAAGYGYNYAAKLKEDGNHEGAARAHSIAEEYATGKRKMKARGGPKEMPGSVMRGLVNQGSGTASGHFPEMGGKGAPAAPPGTVQNAYGQPIPAEAGALPGEPGYRPVAERPGAKSRPAVKAAVPESAKLPNSPPPLGSNLAASAGQPAATATKPPVIPPPTPAEKATIDSHFAKDTKRFGQKAAEALRGALSYAVGMLTAGNGLAWGALIGGSLAGPLGVALGTGIGGSIGGFLAPKVENKTWQVLGGRGRVAATARKVARAVLPKAVGVAGGAMSTAAGIGQVAGAGIAGATLGGPAGQVVGTALGIPAGIATQTTGLDLSAGAAKMTRSALARSPAAKRRARRDNDNRIFAEHFDETQPTAAAGIDPVKLVKARLAAICAGQGKPYEASDDMILAALSMAARDEDQAAGVQAMADGCRVLRRAARKVRKFAGKSRSGIAPFVPNLTGTRGAGLLPFA